MPDAITAAKALGGGLPIGALITGPRLADVLQPGDHGSTFAGGPVVAAAALAALDVIDTPELLDGVRERGAQLADGLAALPHVVSVRGRGLMLACELDVRRPRSGAPGPARAASGVQRHRAHHAAAAAAADRQRGRGRDATRAAARGAVLSRVLRP